MMDAGSLAVTGKTNFPLSTTYYNNDYLMVMSAEGYAAVIVALAAVLCTHCSPV